MVALMKYFHDGMLHDCQMTYHILILILEYHRQL